MESGERPRTAACNLTASRGRCIFKEMRGYPRPRLTSFRPPREPARTRSAHRGMRRGYFPRTASRRPHRPPRTSRAAAAMRRARASSGPLTWLAAPTPAALHRRPHRGVRPAFPSGFSPAARGLRDKGALVRRPRTGARGPAQPGSAPPRARRRGFGEPKAPGKRSWR